MSSASGTLDLIQSLNGYVVGCSWIESYKFTNTLEFSLRRFWINATVLLQNAILQQMRHKFLSFRIAPVFLGTCVYRYIYYIENMILAT